MKLNRIVCILCLPVAAVLWLPAMHLLFRPAAAEHALDGGGVSPMARALLARHLQLWERPPEERRDILKMRRSNPEWDFMGRTFLVGALANLALRNPTTRPRALRVMDNIIRDTLRLEKRHGMHHFLLPYGRRGSFVGKKVGNQFIDGEIAFMLAARRLIQEHAPYRALLRERARRIVARMEESPVLSAESYPNESWVFCNTMALAALRMHDHLDGTNHSSFFRRWIRLAGARLTEKTTGLLISSFTFYGRHLDGPEGSSIWMAAHMLQVIDPGFALEQYRAARRELGRSVFGFAYAREWPRTVQGPRDIDSGLVIPVLEAGPGSSGLAFLGAGAFGDRSFLQGLTASLNFAAFPMREGPSLRYAASNQVGDAVLLYALVQGPLWKKVGPPPGFAGEKISQRGNGNGQD